jgi:hypothetical protein
MNLFGFGTYFCALGHQIRFHCECNTLFNWYDWFYEYEELSNQIKLVIEICKIQMYFSIGSNIQDCWYDSYESYFLRQEHQKLPSQSDIPYEDYEEL